MGIKFFYTWLKKAFEKYIYNFKRQHPPENISIDVLLVDMNGVFHNCAQKIYRYGNYAPIKTFTVSNKPVKPTLKLQQACFEEICKTIETLIEIANPKHELILCIDGPCPSSKSTQQRQRRFRGQMEDPDFFFGEGFDPNTLSPGTKFMHYLSKYIDFYIRKRISESKKWASLKIVFSNEKAPGEGEHKLINYMRKYKNEKYVYAINGLDADLFMLSLGTGIKNIYLLREDTFKGPNDYMYLDMREIRTELLEMMVPRGLEDPTISNDIINDFILICFLCGNDFLPNLQCISIAENSIEIMLKTYVEADIYLTSNNKIVKENFHKFISLLADREEEMMLLKVKHKADYFPDPILESMNIFKLSDYRDRFYRYKKIKNPSELASSYFQGCQWILSYYIEGVKDWKWCFKYYYAPFLSDLKDSILKTDLNFFDSFSTPSLPFQQLLCVLPPKSSNLLPSPLADLFYLNPLKEFCPSEFNINYDGKRKKYEGIVELPFVDFTKILPLYEKAIKKVDKHDLVRNIHGKNFVYTHSDENAIFKSYYGDLETNVEVEEILF